MNSDQWNTTYQSLANLADSWFFVRMNGKRMRHLDPTGQRWICPHRRATPCCSPLLLRWHAVCQWIWMLEMERFIPSTNLRRRPRKSMRMRDIVQGSASTVPGIRAIVWYFVSTLLVIIATATCRRNNGELIQIINGKKEVGHFWFRKYKVSSILHAFRFLLLSMINWRTDAWMKSLLTFHLFIV